LQVQLERVAVISVHVCDDEDLARHGCAEERQNV
jgi:hypothetical protein